MYKRSEPIKWLHSVQNHMANVYSSEVCLQTKNFPKISKFFFFKNTPKYDKLSKISNISIKTILELRTKFGNFGNFGHISDRLQTIHNTCSNLIGSEPLYIPCIVCDFSKTKSKLSVFITKVCLPVLNSTLHQKLFLPWGILLIRTSKS